MRKAKQLGLAAAGIGLVGLVLIAPHGCSREPRYNLLPIGKTMTIMPAAVNSTSAVRTTVDSHAAVYLKVNWEGAAMGLDEEVAEQNPELRFYRHGEAAPFYRTRWYDLKDTWKTTGCTNDQIQAMDGQENGVAMICDGRLGDVNQLARIEGVIMEGADKGKAKNCTTPSVFERAPGVVSVIGHLY